MATFEIFLIAIAILAFVIPALMPVSALEDEMDSWDFINYRQFNNMQNANANQQQPLPMYGPMYPYQHPYDVMKAMDEMEKNRINNFIKVVLVLFVLGTLATFIAYWWGKLGH